MRGSLLAALLVLALPSPLAAYTIVLRSGERIEIPNEFSVTQTTLTYEMAQGFSRTIQLNVVDIAATEQANREAAGSLLHRAASGAVGGRGLIQSNVGGVGSETGSAPSRQKSRTSLTNRDLEALRRRNASGAYELQRRTLPVLSTEEIKRRDAEQSRVLRELAAQDEQATNTTDAAFARQAQSLRLELAETDARLDYYRARLREAAAPTSLTSLATPATTTIAGIPPVGFPYAYGGIIARQTPIFGNSNFSSAFSSAFGEGRSVGVYNSTRSSSFGIGVRIGSGVRRNVNFGNVNFGGGYARRDVRGIGARQNSARLHGYPNGYPFGYSLGYTLVRYAPVNDDVLQLRAAVRELEAARAALVARRRLLEDEARQAGVAPGVLR